MKKHSKAVKKTEKPEQTVGIDLGNKFSRYCVLNRDGDLTEEGRIKTDAGVVLYKTLERRPKPPLC